jgi:hypothetical protein
MSFLSNLVASRDEIESVDGVEVRGHPAAEVADLTCGFEGSKSIMYRRLPDDDGVHSGNGVLPRIGKLPPGKNWSNAQDNLH